MTLKILKKLCLCVKIILNFKSINISQNYNKIKYITNLSFQVNFIYDAFIIS